jgi:transcriptional regulator with XRE-family HTH domain
MPSASELVRRRLRHAGAYYSAREIGRAAGVGATTVHQLLGGRRLRTPRAETLRKLAAWLDAAFPEDAPASRVSTVDAVAAGTPRPDQARPAILIAQVARWHLTLAARELRRLLDGGAFRHLEPRPEPGVDAPAGSPRVARRGRRGMVPNAP